MIRSTRTIIALCLVSAGISFIITLAAGPRQDARGPQLSTLNLSEQDWSRIRAFDPTFADESGTLTQALAADRATLADLLEDPASRDEAILAQVEKVIVSHDQLERRVTQHLLKIRQHLTASQQKQLMGLASESVRQGGYRWRGGRASSETPTTGEGDRSGRRRQGRAE